MARTPSTKSHTPHAKINHTIIKTPISKNRINFNTKENEHPVEVIGRIRDNPEKNSILSIISEKNSLRVKTDIGYRDFTLDGVSLSENEDFEFFYEKFVETRINGVKNGEKCTIMMYGPTGSGKSYTMFGTSKENGIVYRALKGILGEKCEENENIGCFVKVSVLEVYNEEIYDLLSTNSGLGFGWSPKGNSSKVRLEVMGKKAKNATFISGTEAGKISKEIQKVEKRRIIKSTLCNERSSRSHCMIILDVPTVGGRLMLVDMAGSENIEQAGQIGLEAKMQTGKINQGNIALKRVVESIANGDSHVPFRDSKLTMLLQDSFEDDKSKILMILCASPDSKEMHKTISTLEYGAKAKCIVRGPHTPVKEKNVNDESFLAMNQFVLKLQMENKLKEKERNEAHNELMKKEEEISALRAKLARVEEKQTGRSEEEINMKVNERIQMLKWELEKKVLESEKMASEFVELERRKMEETILQQQHEVETLRRRLEEIELELHHSKERNGEEYRPNGIDGNGFAKRLLEMYADEDSGMIKSMDLDKSMELDNKPIFANNTSNNPNMVLWDSDNGLNDEDVFASNFARKVPLSTVLEEDEEEEDNEKLGDEEVRKEVIEEEKTIYSQNREHYYVHDLVYTGDESKVAKNEVYNMQAIPKVAENEVCNREVRIANIFTLCGNYRELSSKNNGIPLKTLLDKSGDYSVSSNKSPKLESGNFDILQTDKENYEPLSNVVSNGDEIEVHVKWEVLREQSENFITTLKVVKDATLADLRKLIEIYLGADNQGFSFLALGDPVSKEKEATVPASKLPIYDQSKGYLASLRPLLKENKIQLNPFTPLQNILNITAAR